MTLLVLIKANKLVFALIVPGSIGVIAVGVECGVGFGVFYKQNAGNSMTTTTTISYTSIISIRVVERTKNACSKFFEKSSN